MKPIAKNGGGGSGSSPKSSIRGSKGPIKTILIGNRIVDTVLFQAIGDPIPRKDSTFGVGGKTWGPDDPKNVLVIKRKANPKMRKRITNFLLEIFIYLI